MLGQEPWSTVPPLGALHYLWQSVRWRDTSLAMPMIRMALWPLGSMTSLPPYMFVRPRSYL